MSKTAPGTRMNNSKAVRVTGAGVATGGAVARMHETEPTAARLHAGRLMQASQEAELKSGKARLRGGEEQTLRRRAGP